MYRSPHRWHPDDMEATPDARLTAALMHLSYWLNRDEAGDALANVLPDEICEAIPEGVDPDTADGAARAVRDNLDADYSGNPEACLSYIVAAVADLRKKEKQSGR
jgi:hypothetical protein